MTIRLQALFAAIKTKCQSSVPQAKYKNYLKVNSVESRSSSIEQSSFYFIIFLPFFISSFVSTSCRCLLHVSTRCPIYWPIFALSATAIIYLVNLLPNLYFKETQPIVKTPLFILTNLLQ